MTHTQLFCGTELAQRIEAAEAKLIGAGAAAARDRGAEGVVLPIAGGFACYVEQNSPMNKVVGLGFGGVPDAADLTEMEAAYARFGAPVAVELSNLADPAVGALLTGRGYRLVGFENVLGRALTGGPEPAESTAEVRPSAESEIGAWLDVVVDGFAHPDGVGVQSHEEFPRELVERAVRDFEKAGAIAYVALLDGVIAAGGSVRHTDGIAQLTGAATIPAYRRRGAQSALLSRRLRDAADAGCDIGVVTTAPGSTSQKNVQRNGFQLLYTRAVLVREPAT